MTDQSAHVRGRGAAHDERRQAILDAVFDVIDTEGAEQVSIRRVADRADVSAGRVQHYFPTKDDLLTAAFTAINDRSAGRIHERLCAQGGGADPTRTLRAVLTELIPETDEDRRLFRVMQAFETHALTRPHLHARVKRGYEELVALLDVLLRPREGAHELLGLTLGLADLTLVGALTPRQARRIVLSRLEAIAHE
ncbi:TetR/AcrR family transcriptional regulator [Allorhizocola rhizosphaerae]|uniref:TetR/AcrR family transcriptional regulator n=1 Tax=Allorhizocola rhizosphaerae TaxID=1872709 RepID=UPI000E3BC636|nr:TetR/AcrR family transcriptional regulator [Allorhizocola rhizosphaerae]